MSGFVYKQKIGFQHCDTAGIVFYPRYFEMFNTAVEEWFEQKVGFSFIEIHMERGEGVPTRHIEVDFKAPSRLGDKLELGLTLTKIGTTSISLSIEVTHEGQSRIDAQLVLVYVKAGLEKTDGWPADLRAGLEKQLQSAGDMS